jgi:hypothetical protein
MKRNIVFLILSAICLVGCAQKQEQDEKKAPSPFATDGTFELEIRIHDGFARHFQRVKIASNGNATYDYHVSPPPRSRFMRKSFVVDKQTMGTLVKTVNDLGIMQLNDDYYFQISDGTDRDLVAVDGTHNKSIHCYASLPDELRQLEDYVLNMIVEPLCAKVEPVEITEKEANPLGVYRDPKGRRH